MTRFPAAFGGGITMFAVALIGDSVYPTASWEFVLGVVIIAALLGATCGSILGRECWRP